MKTILVVLLAILLAIPVLAIIAKATRLLLVDLPRRSPGLAALLIAIVVVAIGLLGWRLTQHHVRWR